MNLLHQNKATFRTGIYLIKPCKSLPKNETARWFWLISINSCSPPSGYKICETSSLLFSRLSFEQGGHQIDCERGIYFLWKVFEWNSRILSEGTANLIKKWVFFPQISSLFLSLSTKKKVKLKKKYNPHPFPLGNFLSWN